VSLTGAERHRQRPALMRFTSLRTGRGALIVNCDPVTTISHGRRAVAEARTIFTLTGRDGQREVRGLPVEHEHQRRTPLSIWWSRTGVRAIVPYVRLRLPSHLLFSPSRILSATYNNYYAHPYSCADNTQISVSLSLRAPHAPRHAPRTGAGWELLITCVRLYMSVVYAIFADRASLISQLLLYLPARIEPGGSSVRAAAW